MLENNIEDVDYKKFIIIKGAKVVQGEDFLSKSSGEDFTKIWGE